MPELPEVETVKRTLSELIRGKQIERAEARLPRIIQYPDDLRRFEFLLAGQRIQKVARRGKFLLIHLDDYVLISHLRMEGRYGLFSDGEPEEKHTHVVFYFTDGTELRYKDVRQFGTMHLYDKGSEWNRPPLNKLGLEPLDDSFTLDAFRKKLSGRKTMIKPLLLNQELVVGIGNIYADEALFRAGIHPQRLVGSLKPAEVKRLYVSIRDTLKEAVRAGGSSVKSYVNGQGEMGMFQHQLSVYGRTDQPCKTCGQPIHKMVVGGRGTHVCSFCQRLPRHRKPPSSNNID